MRIRMIRNSIPLLVAVGVGLAVAGCTITIGQPQDTTPPAPTTMTVKLVNRTTMPLDPQIYVGSVTDGLDVLFAPANQRTSFGFAGLGLIEAGKDASFTVGCDDEVYIATFGGVFGDDLSAPVGQGQQIVLEQDLSVRCGDVAQFTFTADGNTLRTSVTIQPQ
jgi:hypothetical protein